MTKEHEDMPTLTDADAHMLDRLVDAEFDPSKITGLDAADQTRLDRIVSILGLLDSYPVAELSSEDRTKKNKMKRKKKIKSKGRREEGNK